MLIKFDRNLRRMKDLFDTLVDTLVRPHFLSIGDSIENFNFWEFLDDLSVIT